MVIDTGVFIDFLRAKNKHNTVLYNLPEPSNYHISVVSLYELYMGAVSAEKERDVRLITDGFGVLPFEKMIAIEAGKIYHRL